MPRLAAGQLKVQMKARTAKRSQSVTQLIQRLESLGACQPAIDWLRTQSTPRQAWESCERADWLLWIAERHGAPESAVRLAACACARTALQYVPAGEDRPLRAIETAERFARGEATVEELDAAARGARTAILTAGTAAAYAALAAAVAAGSTAAVATDWAARDAAAASAAANYATSDAHWDAALTRMSPLVRENIKYKDLTP